jgi:epoxyqueuosine reductase QueG
MSLRQLLKDIATENGADYFGVSPAARLKNLPDGHRPTDLLPNAQSVIVLGMRIPQGVITAHRQAFEGKRNQIFSFTAYGVRKINDMLSTAAFRVTTAIEKQTGQIAMPIPVGEPHDEELYMGVLSNRYAAVCAGLAQFVYSGFAATKQDGPRVRWVSVVTEALLPYDPVDTGPRLCDPAACRVCTDVCPVQTLGAHGLVTVCIEDFKTTYAARNKALCRCAVSGLVKGTPGRLQADVPNVKTMEDWHQLSKKDDPWQRMEFNHGNYCLRCMMQCPIGTGGNRP